MPFTLGSAQACPEIIFPKGAQFDLALFISEAPGQLVCYFEYQPELLTPDRVIRFATDFELLLHEIIARPDQPVATNCPSLE